MRDVFEQMYGNDMLAAFIVLVLIGSAVVGFTNNFVLITVDDVTTVTKVSFKFAIVAFDATVVTLTGATVVVGVMVVVVGRSYEAITKAPISCVIPGLVKL